jgi:hypothetical protein
MKVFWSWQRDTPESVNKHFVKDALQSAIELVATDLGLTEPERPELDHDTKDEPGLVEIVATIFKKIEAATIFVGDVTPIVKTSAGKLLPNPNVMIELGYALKTLGHEHLVLVANSAFGYRPEDLPFDLRHRRGAITYELKPGASLADREKTKKYLAKSLANALRANLGAALAKRDTELELPLHPSIDSDRSTWLQPGEQIEHQDFFNEAGGNRWVVAEGTRAYMRVTAGAWSKPKPPRRDVQRAPDDVRLWAFGRWSSGDGGTNDLGVVAVGLNPRQPGSVHAVSQWFDKTGEVWGFNSLVTDGQGGKVYLSQFRILKDWATFLGKSLAFLRHFGASPPFRVEAGVAGLRGVHWSGDLSERTAALESDITFASQARDWGAGDRLSFLTTTYNHLCDAFNQPRLTEEQVAQVLASIPA